MNKESLNHFFLVVFFLLISYLSFIILQGFLLSILVGGVVAYMLYPVYAWIVRKTGSAKESAMILSLFAVAAVLGGPLTKRVWAMRPLNHSTAAAAAVGLLGCLLLFAMPATMVSVATASFLLGVSFIVGQNAFMSATWQMGATFRSTSMAMVALCFMVGGAAGVQVASTIVLSSSYRVLFGIWSLATFVSMALCYVLLGTRAPRSAALL